MDPSAPQENSLEAESTCSCVTPCPIFLKKLERACSPANEYRAVCTERPHTCQQQNDLQLSNIFLCQYAFILKHLKHRGYDTCMLHTHSFCSLLYNPVSIQCQWFIAKSTAFFILMLNTTLHVPRMFEICCYLNAAC